MFKPEEAQRQQYPDEEHRSLQVTAAHIPNSLKKLGDQKSI